MRYMRGAGSDPLHTFLAEVMAFKNGKGLFIDDC